MDDERYERRCEKVYKICKRALLLFYIFLFFAIMFSSCRSVRYVPVAVEARTEGYRSDSLRSSRVVSDTVILADTVRITLSPSGDTVARYEVRYRDRISVLRDTARVVVRDSVRVEVPVPVEVEVEKSKSLAVEIVEWVVVLVALGLSLVVLTALLRGKWKD